MGSNITCSQYKQNEADRNMEHLLSDSFRLPTLKSIAKELAETYSMWQEPKLHRRNNISTNHQDNQIKSAQSCVHPDLK